MSNVIIVIIASVFFNNIVPDATIQDSVYLFGCCVLAVIIDLLRALIWWENQ
jgi:hypothetical protein